MLCSQHNKRIPASYRTISLPSYVLEKMLSLQTAATPQCMRARPVETIATNLEGNPTSSCDFLRNHSPHWFLPEKMRFYHIINVVCDGK